MSFCLQNASAILSGSPSRPGLTWNYSKSRPVKPKLKVSVVVIKCLNFDDAKCPESVGKGFYGLSPSVNTKQDVKNT